MTAHSSIPVFKNRKEVIRIPDHSRSSGCIGSETAQPWRHFWALFSSVCPEPHILLSESGRPL